MKPVDLARKLRREAAFEPAALNRGKAVLMAAIRREAEPKRRPTIIPQVPYQDISAALSFLERAFGFREIPTARFVSADGVLLHATMEFGNSLIGVGGQGHHGAISPMSGGVESQFISVQVDDVDAHYQRAVAAGARIANRVAKRRLLMATQAAQACTALTIATLVATGVVAYWHVGILALCAGLAHTLFNVVRQSFVSETVGRDDVVNAVALLSAAFHGARIVGPAAGGLVIASVGMAPAFAVSGAGHLLVIATLATLGVEGRPRRQRPTTIRQDIAEGLAYALHTPEIRAMLGVLRDQLLRVQLQHVGSAAGQKRPPPGRPGFRLPHGRDRGWRRLRRPHARHRRAPA